MRKYETLIFDLDDTLIDNKESIRYAFKIILEKLGIEYNDNLFLEWKKFDDLYWHRFESGEINIPNKVKILENKITYLRVYRFIQFFKELNLCFENAIILNELYCNMLAENVVEIEGARELLQYLNPNYKIFIATNGPKDAATNKIYKGKLSFYISSIISSEEVEFLKPSTEFFNFLFRKIENKDKSKMLLIGDSLTTDILGGMNNGIDTCWLNSNNIPLPEEYSPTMTTDKLLKLKKIL